MNTPKKHKAQMHNKHAEDLAQRILEQLESAWCVKLKELKDEIEELLVHFRNLKGKQAIAGCKTWAQFCERKLHRTDRAVRKMLRPPQAKAQQRPAEQSSASPNAGGPSEASDESGEKEETEGRQRKTAKKTPPLSKPEEDRIAKDQAISKTIGYLNRFDGKEFRTKFVDFWHELRNEMWDKLAPAGAKKPPAMATERKAEVAS
ncbi:MAG TPA: hypothetical protein VK763_03925 [Terriglobales bacterium]|nr:hypothetical protein [Terriglobales bacterium]